MTNQVVLGFGSNLGDRSDNIIKAMNLLADSKINVLQVSSFYETEPWGNHNQNLFINAAAVADTELNPFEVLTAIHVIELEFGRTRQTKYEARTLDIDILFYNHDVMENEQLTIPHPQIHKRNFVLKPLSEIIPEYIHPRFKLSIDKLCRLCNDNCTVIKLNKHETFS
ncbi:MAG: 2-amino-4-hydroxy-6-hydroxymethyldihydropteridine diphosphokinase [Saprospiraceae bacterium]|nr:2-amino-4-hydroxy-6-hydroxymethyldihydropteridine diphosphokinase [Saprospiraceae bacterium]